MPKASPKEIRRARSFLVAKGIKPNQVSPKKFANSAKEMNIGFMQLLQFLGRLMEGGQAQSRNRQEAILKDAAGE